MQGKRKSQSAMEYLMTYGWAILAIAIVMISLYSLGIFNTGNLQPTASPGSCQVIRTASQTSLAGQCGNLIPKYVGQFDASTSYVNIGSNSKLTVLSSKITIVMWVKPSSVAVGSSAIKFLTSTGSSCNGGYQIVIGTGSAFQFSKCGDGTSNVNGGINPVAGTWYFVAGVYNGTYMVLYINNAKQSISYVNTFTVSGPWYLGQGAGAYPHLNGTMSNVQIYNTSLDNATIRALYQEGIGGSPIDLQHLVGWWPLNGNANDYSGNNNQGTATNVVWNANWKPGYSSPIS